MQAIARVNRVFRDKPGGLVVDYLGLADQLKKALITYTESGGQGNPTLDIPQAIAIMLEKHGIACDLMHGFNWDKWIIGKPTDRLALIPAGQERILQQADGKKRWMQIVTELSRAFALCASSDGRRRPASRSSHCSSCHLPGHRSIAISIFRLAWVSLRYSWFAPRSFVGRCDVIIVVRAATKFRFGLCLDGAVSLGTRRGILSGTQESVQIVGHRYGSPVSAKARQSVQPVMRRGFGGPGRECMVLIRQFRWAPARPRVTTSLNA
jgi:Domain of unknown function (DUF3387)